jgi:hypothetical protein
MQIPKGTLITLFEAKLMFPISVRTIRRAVADGRLKPSGKREMPSGQTCDEFLSDDIGALVRTREIEGDSRKLAKRFFDSCLGLGCIPLSVLHHIFSSDAVIFTHDEQDTIDVDLAYACIRLVLQEDGVFLNCLYGETFPNDGSFSAELARLIGSAEDLNVRYWRKVTGEWPGGVDNYQLFEHMYGAYERELAEPRVAHRNLEFGRRPAYLAKLGCKSPPKWALHSVWPIEQTADTKELIRLVESTVFYVTGLGKFLEATTVAITDLSPRPGPPSEDAETREPFVKEQIDLLANDLTRFLGDLDLAKAYCWAVWRQVHHDQIRGIKQYQEENWAGYRPELLPKAVAARVFGAN